MLTQSEADILFAMPKKPKSSNPLTFPHAGGKLLADLYTIMESFLRYCNVQEMPNIERGLFI